MRPRIECVWGGMFSPDARAVRPYTQSVKCKGNENFLDMAMAAGEMLLFDVRAVVEGFSDPGEKAENHDDE